MGGVLDWSRCPVGSHLKRKRILSTVRDSGSPVPLRSYLTRGLGEHGSPGYGAGSSEPSQPSGDGRGGYPWDFRARLSCSPMTNLPDTLQIRPFEVADAEFVARWLCGPGLSVPRGSSAWPERLVRDERIVALVAHTAGEPTGVVRLDCGPDGIAEITIVVAPEQRRSGRGNSMFQKALARAREVGMRRLVAYIDIANESALAFFAECGFTSCGVTGNRIRMDRMVHQGKNAPPLDVRV